MRFVKRVLFSLARPVMPPVVYSIVTGAGRRRLRRGLLVLLARWFGGAVL